jgi:hypothetical protein
MQFVWKTPQAGSFVCNDGVAQIEAQPSGDYIGSVWDNEDGKASSLRFATLQDAKQVIVARLARSVPSESEALASMLESLACSDKQERLD